MSPFCQQEQPRRPGTSLRPGFCPGPPRSTSWCPCRHRPRAESSSPPRCRGRRRSPCTRAAAWAYLHEGGVYVMFYMLQLKLPIILTFMSRSSWPWAFLKITLYVPDFSLLGLITERSTLSPLTDVEWIKKTVHNIHKTYLMERLMSCPIFNSFPSLKTSTSSGDCMWPLI